MNTISDYIKTAKFVRDNILDETVRIIDKRENDITNLNVFQVEESKGSDDGPLVNKNPLFSGRYTLATQLMSQDQNPLLPKVAGELYNFVVTGLFISSFEVEINSSIDQVIIRNTGTGSGQRAAFFAGYDNLIGLNSENAKKLNYDIIKPELDEFIKKHL